MAVEPGAGNGDTPRRVLLLSHTDRPGGVDAAGAVESAGYRVERVGAFASMVDLLQHRGPDARTGAVLLTDRSLPRDDEDDQDRSQTQRARNLGELTRDLGLPLLILSDDGASPDWVEMLDEMDHVLVLCHPTSTKVLEAVLRGVRRRRRLHELRGKLRVMEGRLGDLETAGRREERLLARVGHELRNPLSAITTALSLMREMADADAHGQGERYRKIIERQVELLRKATDNLLDMAGIDSHANPDVEGDEDEERSAAEPDARGGIPVLVVEDDRDGRAALVELLRLWGYEVTMADDGVAGAQHAEERRPAVALVDIDLPGIDGYEVARKIRTAYPEDAPLLIALTGFGQPADQRRALEAGFDFHLVKPVDPPQLARLLQIAGGKTHHHPPHVPALPVEGEEEETAGAGNSDDDGEVARSAG